MTLKPDEEKVVESFRIGDVHRGKPWYRPMPRNGKKTVTILLLISLIFTAYQFLSPSSVTNTARSSFTPYKWHYRLTVTVDTPEGPKTGSAVREVSYVKGINLVPDQSSQINWKGEAVVVDLGERGYLFAMNGGSDLFLTVFKQEVEKHLSTGEFPPTRTITVSPSTFGYPLFVRFQNQKDPKTIQNVVLKEYIEEVKKSDPRRSVALFEEAFGQGVSLKKVTIEVTDDPVNWGIEKYLPWVRTVGFGTLSGKRYSGPEWYDRLDFRYFQRGRYESF